MMDTEEEQEQLYKIQFLQAFGLEEWDDEPINDTMIELYNSMKRDVNLQNIFLHLSQMETVKDFINMTCENVEKIIDKNVIIFTLLFQYNYFDLFHKCIYDFQHNLRISDIKMKHLLETHF